MIDIDCYDASKFQNLKSQLWSLKPLDRIPVGLFGIANQCWCAQVWWGFATNWQSRWTAPGYKLSWTLPGEHQNHQLNGLQTDVPFPNCGWLVDFDSCCMPISVKVWNSLSSLSASIEWSLQLNPHPLLRHHQSTQKGPNCKELDPGSKILSNSSPPTSLGTSISSCRRVKLLPQQLLRTPLVFLT